MMKKWLLSFILLFAFIAILDLRQDYRHTLLNFFVTQHPFFSVPHPE